MQVMSEIADDHVEPQDQELSTFNDMRAGGYDAKRLLQVLYCIVSPGSIMAMLCYIKRRGEKQMLHNVWNVRNKIYVQPVKNK